MNTVMLKIKHEFLKVLPPTVFFFVILHIVALIRVLMIKRARGSYLSAPPSSRNWHASLAASA